MWFRLGRGRDETAGAEVAATTCRDCAEDLAHCHATLVLHADGTAECDDGDRCGADEALHEWWLPCTELRCGCTGDEHDLVVELACAA